MRYSYKKCSCVLACLLVVSGVVISVEAATFELELKRIEAPPLSGVSGGRNSPGYMQMALWNVSPQYFHFSPGMRMRSEPSFSSVVKKEPSGYKNEHVFRGVARLGSDHHGFALDSRDVGRYGFETLYFDINGNGDLTDDGAIAAIPIPGLGERPEPPEVVEAPESVAEELHRAWGPEQATGEPDTPTAGDVETAWASLTPDGSEEWLRLDYPQAVTPSGIDVYETFNPGAVNRVVIYKEDGTEVEVWKSTDPTPQDVPKGVSKIRFQTDIRTKSVRIDLDSANVRGWNEIDAVALVDKAGAEQWAVSAKASSTFAKPVPGQGGSMMVIPDQQPVQRRFPRIDLAVEADGTEYEYSFFVDVTIWNMQAPDQSTQPSFSANASIKSAVYREGSVELDGKTRKIYALDFTSNANFNDLNQAREISDGRMYAQYGDILIIDPETDSSRAQTAGYGYADDPYKQPVSGIICVDGKFYNLDISASGDKASLEPYTGPVGYVTNPNPSYDAVFHGDRGVLKVCAMTESEKVPVPAGTWKLLTYTIRTRALSSTRNPRGTLVSAMGMSDYTPVKVTDGKTTAAPFGPPYKPVVTVATYQRNQGHAELQMTLVGSAGEQCTNVMVDGNRPDKPTFAIATKSGKAIEHGSFEYG